MLPTYVVDTSSLIDLQNHYPLELFPNVWERFESLISANRLIAPEEVFKEVNSSNTFLYQWCKDHRTIFRKNNSEIMTYVQEIIS